jgi:hypothetical protein
MTKNIDQVRQDAASTSEFAAPLAAGTYLVGDPCYAFDNDNPNGDTWMEWLNDAWKDVDANRVRILDGRVRGMRICASGTEHGDGTYRDQDGFEYMVDAGLLGAVHIGFLANLYPRHAGMAHERLEAELGMRVVEFAKPFHVSYEDGVVSVGHIKIDTGDWYLEDEDEAEEDPWSSDDDEE